MNTTGKTMPLCGYCGRPAIGFVIYHFGIAYHEECIRSPDYGKQAYQIPPLSAEQVRQIVREELALLSSEVSKK